MSLGWLTEQSLLPTEKKPISGVSKSSLGFLEHVVEKRQMENSLAFGEKGILKKKKKEIKNEGVEKRIQKDKEARGHKNRSTLVQSKLEEKARLYEKLKKGEVKSNEYLVNFREKQNLVEDLQTKTDVVEDAEKNEIVLDDTEEKEKEKQKLELIRKMKEKRKNM